jgi:hypothetical protein
MISPPCIQTWDEKQLKNKVVFADNNGNLADKGWDCGGVGAEAHAEAHGGLLPYISGHERLQFAVQCGRAWWGGGPQLTKRRWNICVCEHVPHMDGKSNHSKVFSMSCLTHFAACAAGGHGPFIESGEYSRFGGAVWVTKSEVIVRAQIQTPLSLASESKHNTKRP